MKTILIFFMATNGVQYPGTLIREEWLDNMRQCRARMWELASRYGQAEHISGTEMLVISGSTLVRLKCREWQK